MKSNYLAVVLSALIAAPLPVLAQGSQGWYAGGGLGKSELDDWCGGCDDSDTAYKLVLGYQFQPNFALEAAYHDFGDFSARSPRRSEEATALSASGVGRLPLNEQFALFAKAGLGLVETRRDDSINLLVGFGASYQVMPALELRIEYEMLSDVEFEGASDSDLNVLGAAAVYRF
jgi:OOP family OmpA-OmpF porin